MTEELNNLLPDEEDEGVVSPPHFKPCRRTSLGNLIESDGESEIGAEVVVRDKVEAEVDVEQEVEVEDEEEEVQEGSPEEILQKYESMHKKLTEVLRNDLNLDDSNKMSEEEWRRTSPLIFAGEDCDEDEFDPPGSSITASEGGENHFIGGWNELGRLDNSGSGESITIRLKIRGDESFDLTDENDDSIELGKEAYEGLKDLLRRAEQSHKLTREVIEKKTSREGMETPVSDCSSRGSVDTVVKSPRQKPKKRYEDDYVEPELLEPAATVPPPKFNNEQALELLNFLRGSSGIPPALSTVSSSASSSSGSPHRELRVEVVKVEGEGDSEKLTLHPPSPPLSTSSTVVDNEVELVIKPKRVAQPTREEINPVVVVESKRKKKERKRREERQRLEEQKKSNEGKSVR